MSRSYRKPYSAITGVKSAKDDKRIARRNVRRLEKQRIRNCKDFEQLVMPDRLEAAYNDVWSWGRDGKQTLQFPPQFRQYSWTTDEQDQRFHQQYLDWYNKLFRK